METPKKRRGKQFVVYHKVNGEYEDVFASPSEADCWAWMKGKKQQYPFLDFMLQTDPIVAYPRDNKPIELFAVVKECFPDSRRILKELYFHEIEAEHEFYRIYMGKYKEHYICSRSHTGLHCFLTKFPQNFDTFYIIPITL